MERRIGDNRVGARAAETALLALTLGCFDVGGNDRDAPGEVTIGHAHQGGAGTVQRGRVAVDQCHLRCRASGRRDHAGDADAGAEIDERAGERRIQRNAQQDRFKAGAMMTAFRLNRLDAAADECIHGGRRCGFGHHGHAHRFALGFSSSSPMPAP